MNLKSRLLNYALEAVELAFIPLSLLLVGFAVK
jgi:hypothetical protein